MVAVESTSLTYQTADWVAGYESLIQEHDYWIETIEGEIPTQLRGTIFRNGPGRLGVGEQRYGHPFDGDGLIVAIRFEDGRAHFQNRFVRTPEFEAEQKAQKILYRGVFGTQKPGGWLANIFDLTFKNPANTNVVYHGGKLLALWEASLPYRLDPQTLATDGRESFGQALKSGEAFTAHPRRDPKTGDLMAFGVSTGINSTLSLYRINAKGQMIQRRDQPMKGFAFIHDFVWMPGYQVFFQNPVSFNPLPFVLGFQSAGTCLKLDEQGSTQAWIYPDDGEPISLPTEAGFVFHHVNGYVESQDPQILVVDSIVYDHLPPLEPIEDYRQINFEQVPPGRLVRFRLDLSHRHVSQEVLLERSVEFPVIAPTYMGGRHRYIYMGTTDQPGPNAPLQAVVKLDVETGEQQIHSFGSQCFIGEPLFIPQPGATQEDAGWISVMVFDASSKRSFVALLDAQTITAGTVAKLHLNHHVPYGLHGCFTPELFG
ncbi:MAG: Apocarotenoid-15,15'-oxygenase [Synechococcaceae cyanobacterium SM2_3_2]|nr:Apocarotenoid-15,15'-oxygenase [Synechococcaceae cyanobacterium SM2_3_2]